MQSRYLAKITPTKKQLVTAHLYKRIANSEHIIVRELSRTTESIVWKCFLCSETIHVWYKEYNPRYLYCAKCRPQAIHKPDPLLLRYHLIFTKNVHQHIKENSNIQI